MNDNDTYVILEAAERNIGLRSGSGTIINWLRGDK